ncbi:MAG: HIT family protein [Gammaproteobacteria bacterium]|nr:HIT family protein [Pseudomonadales bacterium]
MTSTPKTISCPFCALVDRPAERKVLASNEHGFAIRDGFPVSPGHSLIIPRRHMASFFDLSEEERHALLELLAQTKSVLERDYSPDAYNIGINDGPAAGQTVYHLHIHLIPRYRGDVRDPRGGVRWVIPDKADYWSDRQ